MAKVAEIKEAIIQLSPEDLAELRAWFYEFEAELWEKQIEADIEAGRLDALAEKAIRAFHAGECSEL